MKLFAFKCVWLLVMAKLNNCEVILERGQSGNFSADTTTVWQLKRKGPDKLSIRIDHLYTESNSDFSKLVVRDGRKLATQYVFRKRGTGVLQELQLRSSGYIRETTLSLPIVLHLERKRISVALVAKNGHSAGVSGSYASYSGTQTDLCKADELNDPHSHIDCPGRGIAPGVPYCDVTCAENYAQNRTRFNCINSEWNELAYCSPILDLVETCDLDEHFNCPYSDQEIVFFVLNNFSEDLDYSETLNLGRSTSIIAKWKHWYRKICPHYCRSNKITKKKWRCHSGTRGQRCRICQRRFKCNENAFFLTG